MADVPELGILAIKCPLRISPHNTNENERMKAHSKNYHLEARTLLQISSSSRFLPVSSEPPSLRVSLPITEEIIKSKDDLKKMVVIKVLSGNASVQSQGRGALLRSWPIGREPHCSIAYIKGG